MIITITQLAKELEQLTPVELDAFCHDFPIRLRGKRDTAAFNAMAEDVLRRESYGDAVARIDRYMSTDDPWD